MANIEILFETTKGLGGNMCFLPRNGLWGGVVGSGNGEALATHSGWGGCSAELFSGYNYLHAHS